MRRLALLSPAALLLTVLPAAALAAGLDIDAWLRRPGVRLVAVEFYATWCKPCMAAVPRWRALHERYRKDGLRLVVVATQDADGACSNPGWAPDEVVCDDDGFLAGRFGADSLPAAFLWSWQGHLLGNKVHVDEVERTIEAWARSTPRVDVEVDSIARGAGVTQKALLGLVRNELHRSDKLTVVATPAERKKLRDLIRRSHELNADESLACEIGKEVSANSLLMATIIGTRSNRLQLKLLSAERGCLVASASVVWNPKKPAVGVGEAVAELIGKLRLAKVQYPWSKVGEPSGASPQVDLRPSAGPAGAGRSSSPGAQALEESWLGVERAVGTQVIPAPDRLRVVEKFLADYPTDNPHRPKAERYRGLIQAEIAKAEGRPPPASATSASPEVASDMILVPAGEFVMGCGAGCDATDLPARKVFVGAFAIDRTEATVSDYAECVKARRCVAPSRGGYCNWGRADRRDHPINCLNWGQAKAFCEWKDKRLPTEVEWEKAARGPAGKAYPWGEEEASCRFAVMQENGKPGCGRGTTWPVTSKPEGASAYGALHLAGNVAEWTADWQGEERVHRVFRGGGFNAEPSELRGFARAGAPPIRPNAIVGVRCARSL